MVMVVMVVIVIDDDDDDDPCFVFYIPRLYVTRAVRKLTIQ